MKLYPGVHQLQSLFGGRNLFQYLFVGDNVILLDTGIAETPEQVIFPYLDSLDLPPGAITMAITTHADLDHQGGNAAIKCVSPSTQLACGEADREMIEDPDALYRLRYNHLEKDFGVGQDRASLSAAGSRRAMDLTFTGREKLRLRDNWRLDVIHVPGHSHGHLALFDSQNGAAFIGDAVHGKGCPKASGGMAIPVTYYHVDLYLSTLRYLEGLRLQTVYSGHWPPMRREEFGEFIHESRWMVEKFDRVILRALQKNPGGLNLRELIDVVSQAVGEWPAESNELARFAVHGHMTRLEEMGRVALREDKSPKYWQLI
jgi:glyoxylase-like metal-dependent hydrolase (beta-lactamase superfamily II)